METEDMDAFAEQIREGVFDRLVGDLLAERIAAEAEELQIELPAEWPSKHLE